LGGAFIVIYNASGIFITNYLYFSEAIPLFLDEQAGIKTANATNFSEMGLSAY